MKRAVLPAIALLLTACMPANSASHISLAALEPLPAVEPRLVTPLKVAVAAVISPRGTVESYQPLLDYLAAQLGRPVELIQRRTYAEINDLIELGAVDMAFVCTSAYVIGSEDFGMQLLAAPEVDGAAVYYSVLIVPSSSSARSMADLEGTTFAFTDPMSNTGRAYPTYLVESLGRTSEEFFKKTFFTYSHDDAIRAVADGVAQGAAVDSLVYDLATQLDPSLGSRTRVIHRSPAFGIPPVVVGPSVRPQLRAQLRDLLFGLAESDEGRAILQAMGIDRFVEVEDSHYDTVRDLMGQLESPMAR